MATKGLKDKTVSDIFNCTICLERFKTPKSLPCFHTFCQPCLNAYILSSNRENTAPPTSFSCPICRLEVKPPQQSSPMEEWAELMPLNHMLFSLMDNLEIKQANNNNNCDLCKRDDEISKAEFRCIECRENLCETCKKYHKRHKASINHKVVLITDLKPEDIEIADVEEPCTEHKGEMMKVYCVDHSKMCCVICLSVNHRKCENIKTFDEMAENMKKNEDLQQLTNKITDMGFKVESMLVKKKENIENLEQQHKDILVETSAIVEETKRKLQHCYDQFKKQFSDVQKENTAKLLQSKERLENFHKFLSYCEKTLKAVTEYRSSKQTFVTLEKIKTHLDLQGKGLEDFLKDDVDVSYNLTFNKYLTALNTSMDSIGEIEIKSVPRDKSVFTYEGSDGMNSLQGQLKSAEISELEAVKVWDVNTGGWVSSGVFLDNGNLMCTNRSKNNISMYDNSGKLLNTHQLDFSPFGICQGSDGRVYISECAYNGNGASIRVFTIENQSIKEVKQIKVKRASYAINITDDTLLVQKGSSIHSMTSNGQNDKELCKCINSSGIAVSTYGGEPRFCYCEADAVVCRSVDGREIFRHQLRDLCEPRGIAFDAADNIYVCSKDSNTIFVVSKDGSSSRVFMSSIEKISHPFAIGFDKTGTKFFITCFDMNTLAVYDLSLKKVNPCK